MRSRLMMGSMLVIALAGHGCSDDSGPASSDSGVDSRAPTTDLRLGEPTPADAPRPDAASGFETALPIAVGDKIAYTAGELSDPLSSKDYYKFTGKKGQLIYAIAMTPGVTKGVTAGYLDLVATIYDSSKTIVAQDDDPHPLVSNAPNFYTRLPADGDYYLMIEECNSAYGPGATCAAASGITDKTYGVTLLDLALYQGGITMNVEGATDQDGTPASAIAITQQKGSAGYNTAFIGGEFQTSGDIDVFSLTLPSGAKYIDGQRARATLWLQVPGTKRGNGSTAAMRVWLVDPTDASGKHLAELDQVNYGDNPADPATAPAALSVPLTVDKPHYLYVQSDNAKLGARDFYVLIHTPQSDYPASQVEKADATNGGLQTPESLTGQDMGNGIVLFGIDGDLSPAGADLDHFAMAVSAKKTRVTVTCAAQREGSGLRGFKVTLLQPDGTPLTGGTATETATAGLLLNNIAIPTGLSQLLLKVEAASQDPTVTATAYRCQQLLLP